MKFLKKTGAVHYLLLAPFLVLFALFVAYPIVNGFITSLTSHNGIEPSAFVGLDNYDKIINSRNFSHSMKNLFFYVIITVPLGIVIALSLAILVDSFSGSWALIFRAIYFLPFVLPLFLAATIWRWIYAPNFGILNMMLGWFGMSSVQFLSNPKIMLYSLIGVDLWISVGFNMVILLAGIKNIPPIYYDAARLDGANKFQEILNVTIPFLWPVLTFTVIYGFISALQVFDIPWMLTGSSYENYGGRRRGLLFPVMEMMGRAFGGLHFGQAAAYGFILTLIIMLLTLSLFWAMKRDYKK